MAPRIMIVGGAGFVGRHLAEGLLGRPGGCELLIIDTEAAELQGRPFLRCEQASFLDLGAMEKLVSDFQPQLVIMLASVGMSGGAMLSESCITINVGGTAALMDLCAQNDVSCFIYTSSYNAVFGGQELVDGDESIPIFPSHLHSDRYSASKGAAERLVRQANGRPTKSGTMRTACLRPAAIYGVGELRHLPRIVLHIDSGLFFFRIGEAVVDWVEVGNLVLAYGLLVDKLLTCDDATVPAGQVYCISDGTPIQNFEFLRPLCLARGKSYPSLVLPCSLLLYVALLLEKLYLLSKALGCAVQPLLTRAEVLKVGVTHHFSMRKAERELGYQPRTTSTQGAQKLAQHYRSTLQNNAFFDLPGWLWWFCICLGLALTGVVAFAQPGGALLTLPPMWAVNWLALAIFRSQRKLQVLFWAAWAAHAAETIYAVMLARSLGVTHTLPLWAVQTLLLGFPSVQLLRGRKTLMEKIAAENAAAAVGGVAGVGGVGGVEGVLSLLATAPAPVR